MDGTRSLGAVLGVDEPPTSRYALERVGRAGPGARAAGTGAPGRVVVGVGSLDDDATAVLHVAFAEARAAGCPVRIVHVIEPRTATDVLVAELGGSGLWEDVAETEMADLLALWSGRYIDVDRTVSVRRGDAAAVLLAEATERDVLVVGGHRHPVAVGRVRGPVADAVARGAAGPVVVVHDQGAG